MSRRLTIRARLTLTYTGMIAGSMIVLLVIVYLFLRLVPSYEIVPGSVPHASSNPSDPAENARTTSAIALRSAADFLNAFLVVSAAVLVLVIAGGAVVSWVVAGRVLRPLSVISAAARRASSGALDHRIGLTGPRDEVRELADTFDDMLARLERAFQGQRRFAANASHELRTPLTTTKTMLEVARRGHDPDRAELLELASRLEEVNQRNIETVDSLLDLAEIEEATIRREPVGLHVIAAQAAELVAAERSRRELVLDAELDEAPARGDAVLLRQAVVNLLLNAVRHNVPQGSVQLATGVEGGRSFVRVGNTGPVVPEELVASLTEPFVRGGGRVASRGHGLGLAIVQSVTEAHHGELRLVADPGGGLTATLWVERAEAADAA